MGKSIILDSRCRVWYYDDTGMGNYSVAGMMGYAFTVKPLVQQTWKTWKGNRYGSIYKHLPYTPMAGKMDKSVMVTMARVSMISRFGRMDRQIGGGRKALHLCGFTTILGCRVDFCLHFRANMR